MGQVKRNSESTLPFNFTRCGGRGSARSSGAPRGDDRRDEGARGERPARRGQRQRIPERHAVELRREQVAGADRERQAEHEADDDAPERALQHQPDDVAAAGAERHADADLVGALRDGVGGDAVQADRREHERDDAEEAGEAGHGALLIEGAIDLLLQRPDAGDGQVRIDLGERALDLRLERRRRRRR